MSIRDNFVVDVALSSGLDGWEVGSVYSFLLSAEIPAAENIKTGEFYMLEPRFHEGKPNFVNPRYFYGHGGYPEEKVEDYERIMALPRTVKKALLDKISSLEVREYGAHTAQIIRDMADKLLFESYDAEVQPLATVPAGIVIDGKEWNITADYACLTEGEVTFCARVTTGDPGQEKYYWIIPVIDGKEVVRWAFYRNDDTDGIEFLPPPVRGAVVRTFKEIADRLALTIEPELCKEMRGTDIEPGQEEIAEMVDKIELEKDAGEYHVYPPRVFPYFKTVTDHVTGNTWSIELGVIDEPETEELVLRPVATNLDTGKIFSFAPITNKITSDDTRHRAIVEEVTVSRAEARQVHSATAQEMDFDEFLQHVPTIVRKAMVEEYSTLGTHVDFALASELRNVLTAPGTPEEALETWSEQVRRGNKGTEPSL